MITTEELTRTIDLLRHGGEEGIDLFLQVARRLLLSAGEAGLESWVSIAASALPEEERNLVFTALLRSVFDAQQAAEPDAPLPTTLH